MTRAARRLGSEVVDREGERHDAALAAKDVREHLLMSFVPTRRGRPVRTPPTMHPRHDELLCERASDGNTPRDFIARPELGKVSCPTSLLRWSATLGGGDHDGRRQDVRGSLHARHPALSARARADAPRPRTEPARRPPSASRTYVLRGSQSSAFGLAERVCPCHSPEAPERLARDTSSTGG